MTLKDVQSVLVVVASLVTIVAILVGSLGFVLYRLDRGVDAAATNCEVNLASEASNEAFLANRAYARYVNAKVALLSIEAGVDVRPYDERTDPLKVDVVKYERDTALKEVKKHWENLQNTIVNSKNCPNYKGILE